MPHITFLQQPLKTMVLSERKYFYQLYGYERSMLVYIPGCLLSSRILCNVVISWPHRFSHSRSPWYAHGRPRKAQKGNSRVWLKNRGYMYGEFTCAEIDVWNVVWSDTWRSVFKEWKIWKFLLPQSDVRGQKSSTNILLWVMQLYLC